MTCRIFPTYYLEVTEVDVFAALSNPVRRRVLQLLSASPRTAGSLAGEFDLSRPAVSEHLQVLRNARLVPEQDRGREHTHQLAPEPLTAGADWLQPFEAYWRKRLGTLASFLEEEPQP